MRRWATLAGFFVLMAVFAVLFSDYTKAALGMAIGALAMTALNQLVANVTAEKTNG